MARKLAPRAQFGTGSDKKSLPASATQTADLVAGNEVTVYAEQVPADKVYHWGYGTPDRDGMSSFVYADLQNGNGNAISGQLVLAVTDSTQEDVLAKRYFESLEDLRAAQSDERTERILMPEMQPAAGEDRHLELRVVADAGSDGDTYDPANSTINLNYGTVSA
jgi:hypothetical protein